jgi:hypothetical protein
MRKSRPGRTSNGRAVRRRLVGRLRSAISSAGFQPVLRAYSDGNARPGRVGGLSRRGGQARSHCAAPPVTLVHLSNLTNQSNPSPDRLVRLVRSPAGTGNDAPNSSAGDPPASLGANNPREPLRPSRRDDTILGRWSKTPGPGTTQPPPLPLVYPWANEARFAVAVQSHGVKAASS